MDQPSLFPDTSTPRGDALAKAAGTERFATDLYPEGCLLAGVRRAGIAHARIKSVRVDKARRIPGVTAVLTRADVPGSNRQGIVHKDQPVLAGSKVRQASDPVALILAETRQALQEGIAAVEADFEELPGVFCPVKAMAKGAPLVHEDHPGGNLLLKATIAAQDAPRALKNCQVVITGQFHVPVQEHAFLETQNGVARLTGEGVLEMTVSTQAPFRDRFEIAAALGLNPLKIRVVAPHLGGGFGGKDGSTVQCLLALAALSVPGRSVKMVWDRTESILAGYKRHAAILRYTLGAGADGALIALACRIHYDTGAYAHLGGEIMELGMEHAGGPYRIPNTRIQGYCVYTNNPTAGAFRGFGVAQTSFAIESMIETLASRLGLDPIALRRKNALRPGERNCAGVRLDDPGGVDGCLQAIEEHPVWRDRAAWIAAAPARIRRGVGVAAAANAMGYGRGLADAAVAKLELTPGGGFLVYNAVPDMGQGNASTFALFAAQELSQPLAAVDVIMPDTGRCHPSGSSSASRTTYTFGNALLKACRAMREKLLARACLVLLVDDPGDLTLIPGAVAHPKTQRVLPLEKIASFLPRDDSICVSEFIMPVVNDPPPTGKEFFIGFPHRFFSHAAHLCAVEVDELTGRVAIAAQVTAVEGGAVVNRQCYEQQVQGAVAQGTGYALFEDFQLSQGTILTPDLATYLIPTAMDLPDQEVIPIDGFEPSGPHGLKGIGEVGVHGPLPALAAAISQATGTRITRAPLTPELVLAAIRRNAKREPSG